MLGVYHSSLIYLLFVIWSSRLKKQESSMKKMKKMLSSSPCTCAISVYTLIFMTSVFSIRSQKSRYMTLVCSNHHCDLVNLCVLLLIFLLCMFRLLVAILVKLRLIKMPGEVMVEESSLVEEATEPGPSQASSSAASVSTLLILLAPSTTSSCLLVILASCSLHSCFWGWNSAV